MMIIDMAFDGDKRGKHRIRPDYGFHNLAVGESCSFEGNSADYHRWSSSGYEHGKKYGKRFRTHKIGSLNGSNNINNYIMERIK